MIYELRDYQRQASDSAVWYLNATVDKNGVIVLPTGSGKSLVIAEIAHKLNENVIVLQPSKEILEQNYKKLRGYGVEDCSIYSASCNSKKISRITFATIGSIMSRIEDFDSFRYVIVDECHVVNSLAGRYKTFFERVKRKIIGLTATPYRLSASLLYYDANGNNVFRPADETDALEFDMKVASGEYVAENKCILKFITRTRPRVFHDVVYSIDIGALLQRGYLAKLRYFDLSLLNQEELRRNTTGMDFDETALRKQYKVTSLNKQLVDIVRRLMHPKDGKPRKGILVFTRFIEESEELCKAIEGCVMITGTTKKKEREKILDKFKEGEIKVVTNVGVLTTGFDYPELDTIVIARPTMSLSLYYQIVGRAIRPHPDKESAWIVDLCGNYKRFGKVEDLCLRQYKPGQYVINSHTEKEERQLTNIYF